MKYLAIACIALACSSSAKDEPTNARDECWKSLTHRLSQDLHIFRWTGEQGFDQLVATADDVFPNIVESSRYEWDLKYNRAVISTVYGGWERIEYSCKYNVLKSEVSSVCYSSTRGACQ